MSSTESDAPTEPESNDAFSYEPESFPEGGRVLHHCIPIPDIPDEARTFVGNEYESGKLHLSDLEYESSAIEYEQTRTRYTSLVAARASRRVKDGKASECPFCSDSDDFSFHETRVPFTFSQGDAERWEAKVLFDFLETVVDSCRGEHKVSTSGDGPTYPPDVNFTEIVRDDYDNLKLEILTNTDSLYYAYPQAASLPNWYDLSYAIAQNPWLEVEDVTSFESKHTCVLLSPTKPDVGDDPAETLRVTAHTEDKPHHTNFR